MEEYKKQIEQIHDALIIVDNLLIDRFQVDDGAKRASLCLKVLEIAGYESPNTDKNRVIEIITKTIK